MSTVRLLVDAPEGARGQEVVVAPQRASDLVTARMAERVIVREAALEKTVATEKRTRTSSKSK